LRRAIAAFAGTTAGLVALLGYKSGPAPSSRAPAAAPAPSAARSVPSTSTVPFTVPRTSPSASTTAPASLWKDGSYSGALVATRYGPVQVEVTVRAGRLSTVTPVTLPNERRRSAEISDRAAPILQAEAVQAQGVQIDTVSGATFTSEGFVQSLQAALLAARR
jgi:uncharacterized protein with FMN-binding domain